MKPNSHLFSIGALLFSMAVPAMAAPTIAGPYLVYQGTIDQTSTITHNEGTGIQTKINANLTKFHKLNANLQKDINAYVKDDGGASKTAVYLIVDEANVANYTFVLLDPTETGKRIPSIVSSSLPASAVPENFLSGFEFPTKGGLGVFRLGVGHSTGTDPVSNNPASVLLQGYGTGALVTTNGAQIAPKQLAESFNIVVNGVKGAHESVPAHAAITLPNGGSYMPTFSGTLFGYYFDDSAAQSIGGASTKGSFTLTISPTLTQLANNGGKFEPSVRNIGLVSPISASNTTAFKAWAKSLIDIAVP